MIEPPPFFCMKGAAAWMAKNWWRRFTASRSSQYSTVTVFQSCRSSCAALLTSTLMVPKVDAASAMAAW